ncbi:MAG: sugar phosphate isomerase/epimerase [Tissierellaceae bacterium]
MERKMLYAISSIQELDVNKLNKLELGLEIQDFVGPNMTEERRQSLTIEYMEKLKHLRGIKAIHGPFLDLKPASPDKMIREISHKKYLDTLKIARQLDVNYLIFHSQINPYLNEPNLKKLNNNQAKEFWQAIMEEVPDFKGTIVIENIFEEEPDMLVELIETIAMPNIRINLDIGHANLGKVPLETWFKSLREYISYIHIHSNNGKYDQHRSPSDERIGELYSLLDKYNINPSLSLEYKIENLEDETKRYKGR